MMRFGIVVVCFGLAGSAWLGAAEKEAVPVRQLVKAEALPLALDDAFAFRKVKTYALEADPKAQPLDRMLRFERQYRNFGAVSGSERRMRQGQYFTLFWKSARPADLVVRFEYRQANLGSYVLAKEIRYPEARGSVKTEFAVIGDEYVEDGRVTAWRALLVEGGRVVGLTQSFLWN
jgi:hypothetical protein